ncbi:33054_t:CDS:2, partial [Gigaspora margarita]
MAQRISESESASEINLLDQNRSKLQELRERLTILQSSKEEGFSIGDKLIDLSWSKSIFIDYIEKYKCSANNPIIILAKNGKVGSACYSPFMNRKDIRWLDGAEDWKLVTEYHDLFMLEQTDIG